MKIGQIVAVIGALIVLAGGAGLPLYEMIYEGKTAFLLELGLGKLILLSALLTFPVVIYGFYFRKLKQTALLNVIFTSVGLGLFVYVCFRAPLLYREIHQLPYDSNSNLFIGFMKGGIGFYLLWLGHLMALFGHLKTIGSNPKYPKGTQFLRVAMLWQNTIIKERIFAEGEDVTVGSDLKNMFPLPTDFEKITLIRHKGGRKDNYWVSLAKELEGRLTISGNTDTVSDYKKKHTANTSGSDYTKIKPGDSGVFQFKDLAVFFQFTEPAVAKTQASLLHFDKGMASSALLSFAIQISFLLAIVVTPRPIAVKVKSKEELQRFIKIDVKRDQKKKERQKKEQEERKEEEEKEELDTPEEEKLEEEIEDTPTVEQKLQDAGDPLKKAVDVPKKDEDFKPMKEGNIGRDAKRDSKLAKEVKKKGVIAVLDSKMKKNTSLSKLLGKDRNLAVKNVVWGEDGQYDLANEGDSDFSYMGSSGGTGDYGGGGGFGGAGGFGGGGGGFGGGGAFGLGGMGGMGGGLPGGIGGADAKRSGRMALASLKGRDRKRASKVKLGSGSMGQFCKKSDVQRKVKGRAAAIRACYEMQLQMKPDLAGKVTIQWIIDLTGRVKGAKTVQNSTGNSKLGKCIERILGKIHFQKPNGGMCIIRWPFVFTPGA
jgi:uncharacterized membrane protein YgcG